MFDNSEYIYLLVKYNVSSIRIENYNVRVESINLMN